MPSTLSKGIAVVIVAAGRGTRAGGDIPKQWRKLAGKRVIDHSISAFNSLIPKQIVVALHPDDMALSTTLSAQTPLTCVAGGADRSSSVMAALRVLDPTEIGLVLIHDAARPCVSAATITNVVHALAKTPGAAPALPVTDALWLGQSRLVAGVVDRTGLFRAQTPQGFHLQALLDAYKHAEGTSAADDVGVATAAGLDVTIVPGAERNFKLTWPEDFERAEAILKEKNMDVRTGNGFDVHRFGPGDHVILCGVKIPHGATLIGHSDADVGMHAVTDALYGALGQGDIGQHFPPSDSQWKGAASEIFLMHACKLTQDAGFEITHVDCTLICEHPKIGPHALAMKAEMANLMALDISRVSVKATTSERLGFTGREEGIAALATATLVRT